MSKAPRKRDYHSLRDGEWIRVRMRGFHDACCDCGLVHRINFRIVDGTLEMQAVRDNKATAAMRRRKQSS